MKNLIISICAVAAMLLSGCNFSNGVSAEEAALIQHTHNSLLSAAHAQRGRGNGKGNQETIVATPNLQLVGTGVINAYGDTVAPCSIMLHNAYPYFQLSIANRGTIVWNSGDPLLYPDRYTLNSGKYMLRNMFTASIIDTLSGAVLMQLSPLLGDAGETLPLDTSVVGKYHESASFDGYWISPLWYNATSDNNATDAFAPVFMFSNTLTDGVYKFDMVLDPNNWTNQYKHYVQKFHIQSGTLTIDSDMVQIP